jgi:hypothetical protein
MDKVVVLALDANENFVLLQNSIFDFWAWKYSSTLGSSTINFRPTDAFQTFPFPQIHASEHKQRLEQIGELYFGNRMKLMVLMQLGLTKTYNFFHAKEVKIDITTATLQNLNKQLIEKQHDKEVWNLWNHLQKTPETCKIEDAISGIVKLRELHVQMDNAVLEAYGWQDVQLKHDFYEVDYLPENDRVRYTIHPEARKEILKRLLELNHKIHDEEVKAGLWDKKKTAAKEKVKYDELNEPQTGYGGLWNNVKEE